MMAPRFRNPPSSKVTHQNLIKISLKTSVCPTDGLQSWIILHIRLRDGS